MTWASSIPSVVDGLVSAFAGLAVVFDGPQMGSEAATEAITVGYDGGDDAVAAEGTFVLEGLSAAQSREQYAIRCAVSVLNGAGNISAARVRAYELLAGAGQVLAADPSLGGLPIQASLGGSTLQQSQTQRGAVATALFTVDVDGYTLR